MIRGKKLQKKLLLLLILKSIKGSCSRKNFVELIPQANDKQKSRISKQAIFKFSLQLLVHAYVLKPNPDWLLYFYVFAFHLSLKHVFRIQVGNCCSSIKQRQYKTQLLSLCDKWKQVLCFFTKLYNLSLLMGGF